MNRGEIFGRLTTTGNVEHRISGKKNPRKKLFVECLCDCGTAVWIEKSSLKAQTRSCGCLQKEHAKNHAKKLSNSNIGSGHTVVCHVCKLEFNRSLCNASKNKFNYCSRECMSEHYSERMSGENHPLYNPNRDEIQTEGRQHPDYVVWRREVYKRDNWSCQCCNYKGRDINAHHIKSFTRFPELQFDVSNGITLCINCHKEFHHLYGTRKFTSDDLYEFLKEKGGNYECITAI